MSKITNRLAFFAKIKKRSDDLEVYVAKASGKADVSKQIVAADGHKPFVKREPYVTERNELEIQYSVTRIPDESIQAVVVNQDLKERAQKVSKGRLGGASSYLIREVLTVNKDVRGVAIMVSGWAGKGSISRKVEVEGVWVENPGPYEPDTNVLVEYIPSSGWGFSKWADDTAEITHPNPRTITVVREDVVLAVETVVVPGYTLVFSSAGQGAITATVDGAPVQSGSFVEPGKNVELVPVPNEGYMADTWAGLPEGATVENHIASFIMPGAPVSANISFSAVPEFYGLCLTNNSGVENSASFLPGAGTGFQYLKYSFNKGDWFNWPTIETHIDTQVLEFWENVVLVNYPTNGEETFIYAGSSGHVTYPYKWINPMEGHKIYSVSPELHSGDGVLCPDAPEESQIAQCVNDAQEGTMFLSYSGTSGTNYSWSLYLTRDLVNPVISGTSVKRNPSVGDVITLTSCGGGEWTVSAVHFTNTLTIWRSDSEVYQTYITPCSTELGIRWANSDPESTYYAISEYADVAVEDTVTLYDSGSYYDEYGVSSFTPDSYITIPVERLVDVKLHLTEAGEGMCMWSDSLTPETATVLVMTESRWPRAGEACQYVDLTATSPTPTPTTIASADALIVDYTSLAFTDKLYLNGVSDYWYGDEVSTLTTSETVTASGRASSIITGTGAIDEPADFSGNSYALSYLFADFNDSGNFVKITDASGLVLDDEIGEHCYNSMFYACTTLVTPPSLPATDLDTGCYLAMFEGCTSLTAAPALPATTLVGSCYMQMFEDCTSLTATPALSATTLAQQCYSSMFYGCTSLTSAPSLPATTLADSCYSGMFKGCTSLTTAPDLPAITLTYMCYQEMFKGCTSLNSITCLATDISGYNCINEWVSGVATSGTFNRNSVWAGWEDGISGIPEGWTVDPDRPPFSGLKFIATEETTLTIKQENYRAPSVSIKCQRAGETTWTTLESTTSGSSITFTGDLLVKGDQNYDRYAANNYCNYFVIEGSNVSVSGNIMSLLRPNSYENATVLSGTYTFYQLFRNCTALTDASGLVLPATTLAEYSYYGMFYGCSNLTSAPDLPATTLAPYCYHTMFDFCTSLVTPPTSIAATELPQSCCSAMFEGCTALTSAPTISATTVNQSCCSAMFTGCTSLTTAPSLPATTLADNCYSSMFKDCTSLTATPVLPATTLANLCYDYMFSGCSSLSTITCYATNISATNCLRNWVIGVAASGTFNRNPNLWITWPTGNSGVPTDWTIYPPKPDVDVRFSCENGSVTATVDGITIASGAKVQVDKTVVFTITPNEGYEYRNLKTVSMVVPGEGINKVFSCVLPPSFTGLRFYPTETPTMTITYQKSSSSAPSVSLMFSTDGGVTWTTKTATYSGVSIQGPQIFIKASANNSGFASGSYWNYFKFSAKVKAMGNAMSLLYSSGWDSPTIALPGNSEFEKLFNPYGSGTQVNNTLISVSDMTLPAMTLSVGCYRKMFLNCRQLIDTPALPATTLTTQCYFSMFEGCYALSSVSPIAAEEVGYMSMKTMFKSCTSLTTATDLPLNHIVGSGGGLSNMFEGCTHLVTAPNFTAASITIDGDSQQAFYQMFKGCTSLTTAPSSIPLSSTSAQQTCYEMFRDCSALTSAPTLPATTLSSACYGAMFHSCTSLVTAPALPAATLSANCYDAMFYGCTKLTGPVTISATSPYWSGTYSACGSMFTSAGTATGAGGTIRVGGNATDWNAENCGINTSKWTVELIQSDEAVAVEEPVSAE